MEALVSLLTKMTQDYQGTHGRRGCVTPFQLVQWKEASEGDMDLVDGYEELPPDVQDKVKRAIMQGHVDDADWKGVGFYRTRA